MRDAPQYIGRSFTEHLFRIFETFRFNPDNPPILFHGLVEING